ncbi:unnamed protein product [Dracunculus medinensis]|uniref:DUF4817 domain-containing protein n=1 Tax=Dracunculus medinensis TaxID=318479 RepID=A0A0N4UAB2_DRAME|nr:unnamed protein product [Dracunculus medinensis]
MKIGKIKILQSRTELGFNKIVFLILSCLYTQMAHWRTGLSSVSGRANQTELQLLITYLFLSSLLFYAAPSPEIQIISNSESTNIENEAVDLLISYRFGDKQNSQRLFGTFSNAGSNYETAGDIIQKHTFLKQK